MAKKAASRAYQQSLLQVASTIAVAMHIPREHPLLVLKRSLNWPAIRAVVIEHLRDDGRNVAGGPGRPLDVDLYVPLIVLMVVTNKNSRQMEEYLGESAVARIFVDREQHPEYQVRDHSNIARILDSLGSKGLAALNGLIVGEAVKAGYSDPSVLSADTTAQELPIGYPNEPGILKGLAQRCQRALRALGKRGKRLLKNAEENCRRIIEKAKEHHLFAKTQEKKKEILGQMVKRTRRLINEVEQIAARQAADGRRAVRSAAATLSTMADVARTLLPQIAHWMKTQRVAKGKILHPRLTEARAIVRNKAGKKVEFGMQYLIGALGGGYIFAQVVTKPTGETAMPERALAGYREILGSDQTPELLVYDRGGWSKDNIRSLKDEGVQKVGIQPRGKARWRVGGEDRRVVMRERGKTEGIIGTLKSDKYKFNKPKARRSESVHAAGQKSVLSFNLNKFARDSMKAAVAGSNA